MTGPEMSDEVVEVYIDVPTSSGGTLRLSFSEDCTAGDFQRALEWLDRMPWTAPDTHVETAHEKSRRLSQMMRLQATARFFEWRGRDDS